MTVTVGILLNALSTKAKELVEGMRSRVKRDPDVADFAAAFKPLIESFAAAQPGLSEGQVTELANSVIDRAWQRVKGLGGAPSIADWRIVISEAIRAASQSPAPLSEGQVRLDEANWWAARMPSVASVILTGEAQARIEELRRLGASQASPATQPAAPQAPVGEVEGKPNTLYHVNLRGRAAT